jgi:rhomboid protease GluP
MLARPEIGMALQRDPVMLQGEYWRFVTTWFVLTDGWVQIVVNSLALLIFGTLVERRLGRVWWLVGYVAAGLAGEVAGIFWQPVGGGNSVAICGLIALFSISQLRDTKLPLPARFVSTVFWLGLGLWLVTRSDIHGAALVAGFAVASCEALIDPRAAA